jgi:hypothetical protein
MVFMGIIGLSLEPGQRIIGKYLGRRHAFFMRGVYAEVKGMSAKNRLYVVGYGQGSK